MSNYLNPTTSITTERNCKNFIDQTELLVKLNLRIKTLHQNIMVSRPHQFGKTFATKMICSYYSKAKDSSEDFDKLKVATAQSYRKHLNQYNVIFFNIDREFCNDSHDVQKMIKTITSCIKVELKEAYPESSFDDSSYLSNCLEDVYQKTGIPFIIVIDDYDYMIRKNEISADNASLYLNWLTSLLKDQSYVALSYVTGILPIDNLRVSCGLNMFDEYTMVSGIEIAPYFGLTEEFVKTLCLKHQADYQNLKKWYGGYAIEGDYQIFNPISVFEALEYDSFSDHWTSRNPHLHDRNLINMDIPGLRDALQKLVEGKTVYISMANHCYKMEEFKTVNEVLTRLIHLGYLSAKDCNYCRKIAFIPNEEVKREFKRTLNEKRDETSIVKLVNSSFELLNYISSLKSKSVENLLNNGKSNDSNHKSTSIDEVAYKILEALYVGTYDNYAVQTNIEGLSDYKDLVFIPKIELEKPFIIIGIMCNVSPEIALEHLEQLNYRKKLDISIGEILLVSISYYQTNQSYQCKIEKILLSE